MARLRPKARRLAERLEIYYTPKYGNWLNMAEIELSILSRQCPDDYFENADHLARRVELWERKCDEEQTNIDWQLLPLMLGSNSEDYIRQFKAD